MSTLGRILSEGLEKARFTVMELGRLQEVSNSLSTGINVTGNTCSEASPEEQACV